LPVPPLPFSKTGTFVPQILVANRRTCCIVDELPKITSSGGKISTGSVPLRLLVFAPGMFVQKFLSGGNIAQGRPLRPARLLCRDGKPKRISCFF